MKENLYKPADSKEVQAFNTNPTFCHSAKEVERQDREFALDQIAALAESVKREIAHE